MEGHNHHALGLEKALASVDSTIFISGHSLQPKAELCGVSHPAVGTGICCTGCYDDASFDND